METMFRFRKSFKAARLSETALLPVLLLLLWVWPPQPATAADKPMVAAGANHTVGLKADGTVLAVGNNEYGQLNVAPWTGIAQVSAGEKHTVGLKADGTVLAVGNNDFGKLDVTGWTGMVQVAAGNACTMGLKADGTVMAVGYNGNGQLDVGSWTGITQVAAKHVHTAGLKADGTVVAAGSNSIGQLNVDLWTGITQVAAGWYHTVGLKSDGTVVATGLNEQGQLEVTSWTGITQITAGWYHTVGLKSDGTVVATGLNDQGQLEVTSWTGITQVATGNWHTLGLKSDGTVVATGLDSSGQTGVSSWNLTQTTVSGICGPAGGGTFTAMPAGTGLCAAGTPTAVNGSGPWTWSCEGANGGAAANCSANIQTWSVTPSAGAGGTISPDTVRTVNHGAAAQFTVTANQGYTASVSGTCGGSLSGTAYTTNPVTADCTVSATFTPNPIDGVCGAANGQALTAAPTENLCVVGAPTAVAGAGPWTWSCAGSGGGATAECTALRQLTPPVPQPMVAAAYQHTVGLQWDGTVLAVGDNPYGQLNVAAWTGIAQVSAGDWHTAGLKSDGAVVAAGYNGSGQLNVTTWSGIAQIAAGGNHTIGLKSDGTVVATGYNSDGQLSVTSWAGVTRIATGWYNTVGLKADGTIVAAGSNTYGQLNVGSWTGIVQVAAGTRHIVGLKADGTVLVAGDNTYGQSDVTSWTGIAYVAAGHYFTVGLKTDGTVVAVGDNSYGQLAVTSWTGILQVAAGAKQTVGLRSDGTVVAAGDNTYGQIGVSAWVLGQPPTIAGACGTSHGQAFTFAPAEDLCSAGIPTAVSGTGPWSWSCAGTGGGATAACSAEVAVIAEKIPMVNFTPEWKMNLSLYDPAAQRMDAVKQNNNATLVSLNSDYSLLLFTEMISVSPKTYRICRYHVAAKTTACLATPTVEEDSAFFDGNDKILFIDSSDGVLKRMNPDGTGITVLATAVSPYRFSVFWMSPDRQRVLAVEERQIADYYTTHYERLVLMNADGTNRVVLKTEILGEWNMLNWRADAGRIFYYYHSFNVAGGVYQGKIPHYVTIEIPAGTETELTESALGGRADNVCRFTKSGNLLSWMHHELYDGQTGALIGFRADAPSMMEAMAGSDRQGEVYFADPDGTDFRRFLEFALGDLNSDHRVDLADAIISLQVLSGMNPTVNVSPDADVHGDGRIGLAESIYILQKTTAMR